MPIVGAGGTPFAAPKIVFRKETNGSPSTNPLAQMRRDDDAGKSSSEKNLLGMALSKRGQIYGGDPAGASVNIKQQ